MTNIQPLLLASQSPRRAELLTQIGVDFEVVRVDVPEIRAEGEAPSDYVLRLAQDKSRAGATLFPGRTVLGADTVVVCDGAVLEKPRDKAEGVAMLLALGGRCHHVITAVALTRGEQQRALLNQTEVVFRKISEAEAQSYWDTGEPCDKAGGYGIQGLGAIFVEAVHGSYSSVVGLPLYETSMLLQQFEIPVWSGQNK